MPESVLAGTSPDGAENQGSGQPNVAPLQGDAYTSMGGPGSVENASGLVTNEGNAVFSTATMRTSQLYQSDSIYDSDKPLPERFDNPELTKGYGSSKRQTTNPMYRTSGSTYGGIAPSVHTMQTQFHGRSQGFSNHLAAAGMPSNRSLNCFTDRSRAHVSLDQSNASFAAK